MLLHHLVYEIQGSVTSSFWTQYGASPLHAFTREGGTTELGGQFLIHSEKVAYLTSTYTDVARRHVHIGADNLVQLPHKGLTEAHDLGITLATWREVGATLAATHGQRSKGILESLLEAQEFQDT